MNNGLGIQFGTEYGGYFSQNLQLTKRFSEAHKNNLAAALRFLKYGESILDAIKEPFRKGIYQPLIVLENEVL